MNGVGKNTRVQEELMEQKCDGEREEDEKKRGRRDEGDGMIARR